MENKRITGVYPTMITPYKLDGSVDHEGLRALTEWYWKMGCDGIFSVCQSSEMFALTLEERVSVARTVKKEADRLASVDKSREPMKVVVSGHISDDFDEQVTEVKAMASVGTEAVILITNRFDIDNTSEEKWISDLERLLSALRYMPEWYA